LGFQVTQYSARLSFSSRQVAEENDVWQNLGAKQYNK